MLSVFPEILFLAPLSATILRAAVACIFFYSATMQVRESAALAETPVPIFGKGMWIVRMFIISDTVIGVMLLTGSFTQVAAIFGMIGAAVALIWMPTYLERTHLSRGTVVLTFIILLSLLLTGAGSFAFDLPL